jgi:hypothetical protein
LVLWGRAPGLGSVVLERSVDPSKQTPKVGPCGACSPCRPGGLVGLYTPVSQGILEARAALQTSSGL